MDTKLHVLIQLVLIKVKALRLSLTDEKKTQQQLHDAIKHYGFTREYHLDKQNIPDCFFEGIAIEIKIKGSKMQIYEQCKRYCDFAQVKALILCTSKSMGFPKEINGKPCYYINIGKAWL